MVLIETKGFDVLENLEKTDFERLVSDYSKKIQRRLKNIEALSFHLKEYNKEGNRKKFSIHVRVTGPFKTFEASSDDWDFNRTVHQVFQKLENEIESTFHVSNQHRK